MALDDVLAPPYDVVGPNERKTLAARSPYNSILVELPEDPTGGDRYDHAASLWRTWHQEGVVEVAVAARFYVYRMTFTDEDGTRRATTGVVGALGLDPTHSGEVLPHEETTPKDKHDRLSLLRAARTNFSPIWGLSLSGGLGKLCESAAAASTEGFGASDEEGVLHECFVVEDPEMLERIGALVAETPVLIADGHHRYETACAYEAERPGTAGAGEVMALVVELSPEELAVQAIHRVITGVETGELLSGLEASFEISPGPRDLGELKHEMAARAGLGLFCDEDSYILVPRPGLLADGDDDLDSTRLEHALERVPGAEVTYQHGMVQSARSVTDGRAAGAVMLRPVSVDQIAAVAHGGRRMPPKSTFFYPKPRTGVVFRELDAG